MVVDDFYLYGVPCFPKENNAPLLIYSDAPKACKVTCEPLQMIAWWNPQIIDILCIMQLNESSPGPYLKVRR